MDARSFKSRAAGLAVSVGLVLGGCTSLPTPIETPSPSITIPADWPSQVPLYPEGELTAGFVSPDGSFVASWEVVDQSESEVAGEYDKSLSKAGFRAFQWYNRNFSESGEIYSGHGLEVSAGTSELNGTVVLNVSVTCVKRCPDSSVGR